MRAGAAIIAAALVLGAAAAHGAGPENAAAPLSLARAEELLVRHNAALAAAREALEARLADRDVAAQPPNPGLSLNAASIQPSRGLGAGPLSDKRMDTIVRYEQLVERGGKRELRIGAAEWIVEASRNELAVASRASRLALYAAYYDLVLANERLQVAEGASAACYRTLRDLESKGAAGSVQDRSRLRVDALRAEHDARVARADMEKAQLGVAYLIGMLPDARTIRPADGWPAFDSTRPGGAAVPTLREPPEVAAARARLQAAEKGRELARSLSVRDVTVGVQFERDLPDFGNSVGVGVAIPLLIRHAYQGEIRRTEADRNAARIDLERATNQAASDLARARADLDAAVDRIRSFREVLVVEAEQAARSADDAYTSGKLAVIDLLDARRILYATRLDYAAAQADYARALAAWRAAMGSENWRE